MGGSRYEKLAMIEKATLEAFRSAKAERMVVHDIDLRRRSLHECQKVGMDNFKASGSWLLLFKKKKKQYCFKKSNESSFFYESRR